jgi:cell division ATPase FtsA
MITRSSFSLDGPRTITGEDVSRVLASAIPPCDGRIIEAVLVGWSIDGEPIDNPIGAKGGVLAADIDVLILRSH